MRRWMTVICISLVGLNVYAEDAAETSTATPESESRYARLLEVALLYELNSESPIPRRDEPILRYSNPTRDRGSTDGLTLLWTKGKRPIAVQSVSIRRPTNGISLEACSLSDFPLTCSRTDQIPDWKAPPVDQYQQPFPGAKAPVNNPTRRLSQLRDLARRFEVVAINRRTSERVELRVLPQPLYRFSDAQAGILDGALFAFVVANDPEMLVLIEAVEPVAGGDPQWVYTLARMTSHELEVRIEDELVQRFEYFYAGDRYTQSYCERPTDEVYELPE